MNPSVARRVQELEQAVASGQRLARYWWGQGDCNFAFAHTAGVLRARAELDRLRSDDPRPAEETPGFDDVLLALELLRLRRA